MILAALIYAGLCGFSFAVLVVCAVRAPLGYEIPGVGFVRGPEPIENLGGRLSDGDAAAPFAPLHSVTSSARSQRNNG